MSPYVYNMFLEFPNLAAAFNLRTAPTLLNHSFSKSVKNIFCFI